MGEAEFQQTLLTKSGCGTDLAQAVGCQHHAYPLPTPPRPACQQKPNVDDLSFISDSASGQDPSDSCSRIQLFNRDHQEVGKHIKEFASLFH